MAEYGTLFKSKTLERLYTPEYKYQGIMPRTTNIIDKKQVNVSLCMMGFRPNTQYSAEVKSVADVKKEMHIITSSSVLNKEIFTPIVHCKDGKYYFDSNQTIANALIRYFKKEADKGIERNFHSVFPANSVDMNLGGKEFEAWKQRALSQPILLKKSGKTK